MTAIRIIFTSLLAPLLVILLVLTVYVADLRATAMSPAFVEKQLTQTIYPEVEPDLKHELGDSIREQLAEDMGEEEAQIITQAITDSITRDWVEDTAHSVVTGLYDYINSDSTTLNLTIPFSAESKEGMKEALGTYFTAEAADLNLSQTQVDAGLEVINRQVDDLPDELTLVVENLNLGALQDGVDIFGHTFIVLIFLALLVAVLLVLLHFKLKDATRVIGFCVFVAGLISYVAARVTISILDGRVDAVDWSFSADSDVLLTIDPEVVMTVLRNSLHPATIYGIIFMAVGAALVLFSFLWRDSVKRYVRGRISRRSGEA